MNRSSMDYGSFKITIAATAVALLAGCTSAMPVGEFEHFDGAIRDLQVIATDAPKVSLSSR